MVNYSLAYKLIRRCRAGSCPRPTNTLYCKLQFTCYFEISLQAQLSIAKDERMCYNLPNLIV